MPQITITHKKLNIAARLAVIAGVGLATTALAIDLAKLPSPSAQKGVTYAKDIQPIFQAACFDCHGAKGSKGGLRLDSMEATLKGGRDGAVILAGKSDKSELVINICWEAGPDHPMPPKPQARRGSPGATSAPDRESAADSPWRLLTQGTDDRTNRPHSRLD